MTTANVTRRRTCRPWTTSEHAMLVEFAHLDSRELAVRIGRTRIAVRGYASRSKISLIPSDHAIYATQGRLWTPADDALLATNAHLGYKRVAEILGRARGATRQRASVLKVSLKRSAALGPEETL